MYLARDFREFARNALSGKWALAVGTGFIAALLGAYTALDSSGGSGSTGSDSAIESLGPYLPDVILGIIVLLAILVMFVALIMAVVCLVLSGPVSLGYVKFNLNLVDNKKAQFSDLFSQFDRFGEAFIMQLLRWIFTILWSLLLLIPGIIATYRYAMAPYILYENPGMSGSEAIEESKRLMDGNKWRLFCLNFSFIGWDILCALTLGIGYLWLKPYREAAYAAFYRDIQAKGSVYDYSNVTFSDYNPYDSI